MPRSPRRPASSSRASPSRPSAVDRSSATDCLPAFSRSKNWLGPRRAPSGRSVDSTLTTVAPGGGQQGAAEGSRPQRTQLDDDRLRQRGRRGRARPNERRSTGGAARRQPVEPRCSAATGRPRRRPRSTTSRRRTAAHRRRRSLATGRRAAPRARARPARAPRRRGAPATPPSTRHGREGGGWRPPRWWNRAGGGPRSRRARPAGPAGRPRARPPRARRRPRHLLPESGQAGHEAAPAGPNGSPSGRPVSAMAPLAAHASSSTSWVQRGSGDRSGRARCDNDRPPPGGPSPPWPRTSHLSATWSPPPVRAVCRPGRSGHQGWCAVDLDIPVVDAPPCRGGGRASSSGVAPSPSEVADHATCDVVVAADGDDLDAIEATVASNPLASTALDDPAARGRRSSRRPRGCCRVRGVLLAPGRAGVRRVASGPPGQGALDGRRTSAGRARR